MTKHRNKIQYHIAGCVVRGHRRYSMTPIAIRKRKCREAMKKHIDCRICSRCRYPFISRAGCNNCSTCYQDAHDAYRQAIMAPENFKFRVSLYREWAQETGFFPFPKPSKRPKIPIPEYELKLIRLKISTTMDLMKKSAEKGEFIVRQMPRIVGSRQYLELQPVKDLRKR